MEFVNTTFPGCVAFGVGSDTEWSTDVATTGGGFDWTNQNWQDARQVYDVSFAVRTSSDYSAIKRHFNEVRGRALSFPFTDFLDYQVDQEEGVILTNALVAPAADGTFYLHKKYGSVSPYFRKITRPDSPIVVFRTRAAVTLVITPTVTYTTGAVAITGHMSGDTYAWSGTFKVPCRYDTDRLPGLVVDKEPSEDGELLVQCSSIPIVEVRE